MSKNERIIERHQQLYEMSCPSAAVELVLKLHGKVCGSYRKIQDTHKNKSDVGYGPFRNRRIGGLYFYERSWDKPFVGLTAVLHKELTEGRFPILSMWSDRGRLPDGRLVDYYHEWVIIRKVGADFEAVSKHFRKTQRTMLSVSLAKSSHTIVLLYST